MIYNAPSHQRNQGDLLWWRVGRIWKQVKLIKKLEHMIYKDCWEVRDRIGQTYWIRELEMSEDLPDPTNKNLSVSFHESP